MCQTFGYKEEIWRAQNNRYWDCFTTAYFFSTKFPFFSLVLSVLLGLYIATANEYATKGAWLELEIAINIMCLKSSRMALFSSLSQGPIARFSNNDKGSSLLCFAAGEHQMEGQLSLASPEHRGVRTQRTQNLGILQPQQPQELMLCPIFSSYFTGAVVLNYCLHCQDVSDLTELQGLEKIHRNTREGTHWEFVTLTFFLGWYFPRES